MAPALSPELAGELLRCQRDDSWRRLPLPSASELLEPTLPSSLLPLPLVAELSHQPTSPPSPPTNLSHSRLARRWFKGIADRNGVPEEEHTQSLLDLTQLCKALEQTDDDTSSPTSIMAGVEKIWDFPTPGVDALAWRPPPPAEA